LIRMKALVIVSAAEKALNRRSLGQSSHLFPLARLAMACRRGDWEATDTCYGVKPWVRSVVSQFEILWAANYSNHVGMYNRGVSPIVSHAYMPSMGFYPKCCIREGRNLFGKCTGLALFAGYRGVSHDVVSSPVAKRFIKFPRSGL
jgi:hypothetical protein